MHILDKIQEFLEQCGVLDVESTSDQPSTCEIIELAYGNFVNGTWVTQSTHYNPGIEIPAASAEKHFITDEMVKDCGDFSESWDSGFSDYVQKKKYLVGHNVKYDREAILNNYNRREVQVSTKLHHPDTWICTFDLANALFSNEYTLPAYRLAFLWFYFKLYDTCDRVIIPHQADSDIYMAGKLLEYLVNVAIELGTVNKDEEIGQQILAIINADKEYTHWPYGKHKGKLLTEIPNDYYEWCLNKMDFLKPSSPSYNKALHVAVLDVINKR
jgi:exodeoxyribonuclease X